MPPSFDPQEPQSDFDLTAPLFPLPNCVVFPHVMQPLHIFEPRYRQMTRDALAGDRLLAMALLKPAADEAKANVTGMTPPAIFPMVCLGRITAEERLPDGRYFLVFRGEHRALVLGEEDHDLPYRVGRLKRIADIPVSTTFQEEQRLEELLTLARQIESTSVIDQILSQAGTRRDSLGFVCDVLAYLLDGSPADAQAVLSATNIEMRSELVLSRLRKLTSPQPNVSHGDHEFPPPFSCN